ncbi:hypothetical protein D3C85_1393000 [compost metagenome]
MVENASTVAPALTAFSVVVKMETVVPEPEATIKRSPDPIAGVVISPTTNTLSPKCISRIAAAFKASPERPAAVKNSLSALYM